MTEMIDLWRGFAFGMIIALVFGMVSYSAGYRIGQGKIDYKLLCSEIDEVCHEEVLYYAKLCIEEKEVYYPVRIDCPVVNGLVNLTMCYDWNKTETVKELWDTCDGVRIR